MMKNLKKENSIIIDPCEIGDDVSIINSIIGPNVIIGSGTKITDSIISNSSIGKGCDIKGKPAELSISDYSQVDI